MSPKSCVYPSSKDSVGKSWIKMLALVPLEVRNRANKMVSSSRDAMELISLSHRHTSIHSTYLMYIYIGKIITIIKNI